MKYCGGVNLGLSELQLHQLPLYLEENYGFLPSSKPNELLGGTCNFTHVVSTTHCQVHFTASFWKKEKTSVALSCHGAIFTGFIAFFLNATSGLYHKITTYPAGISRLTSSLRMQSLGTKSSAQRVWNNHHPSRCFHAHLGNADRRCDLTPFEWQLLPLSEILIYIRLKARLRKFVSECYTELLSSTPKDTLYLLVICSIHLNIDRESLAALR